MFDVVGFTLLQRSVPNAALVASSACSSAALGATMAIGGFIAPILVDLLGIEGDLIATGAILPILAVLTWPVIRNADRAAVVDTAKLTRIRTDPLFAPLSMAMIEQLAGELVPVTFEAGEELIREGDPGDRYYLIEQGRVPSARRAGTCVNRAPERASVRSPCCTTSQDRLGTCAGASGGIDPVT